MNTINITHDEFFKDVNISFEVDDISVSDIYNAGYLLGRYFDSDSLSFKFIDIDGSEKDEFIDLDDFLGKVIL